MKRFISLAAVFSSFAFADYVIDPKNVPITTRDVWCTNQVAQCPLICVQMPGVWGAVNNECNSTQLTFSCVCSDGKSPNLTEYSQTLPYYICSEWGNECVSNCNGDHMCQSSCRENHPCGAKNPTRVNMTTASATSASATGVPAAASTSIEPITPTNHMSNAGKTMPVALYLGQFYGLPIVGASLFISAALLL